jgi:CO/xanthine dehydrogenase FAD-binding subunit
LRRFSQNLRPHHKDIMGSFVRPASLSHALACRAAGAEVLAGGTDFWPSRVGKPAYASPDATLLDLSALSMLRAISHHTDTLRIGALATWTDLADASLPPACLALQMAAREVGGRQIQNRGTIGGNLCNASPAADGVPPLLALDASVEIQSSTRVRVVPLAEFLHGPRKTALQPNEILTALIVPLPHASARSHFLKLGARKYQLISIVMGAAVLRADAGRVASVAVAIGACSPVAQRLHKLEAELVGIPIADLGRHVTAKHLADLSPIDDVRADGSYRREAAFVLVRRLLTAFEGPA